MTTTPLVVPADRELLCLPSGVTYLTDPRSSEFFCLSGFFGLEQLGRWSDGPSASIAFRFPENLQKHVLLKIRAGAFAGRPSVPQQLVSVSVNGMLVAEWAIKDPTVRSRTVFLDRAVLASGKVTIHFAVPTCAAPRSLGMNNDSRLLGIFLSAISWQEVDQKPDADSLIWQLGRMVGSESRKSFDDKIESQFWKRFITGPKVLDIGFRGGDIFGVVPIMEGAIGVDLDFPGYNGRILPFGDDTQDAVYSSHCLEHIPDFIKAVQEWYRVTRIGGHIITVVPSMHLYERRRRPPSMRNSSHVRFYSPASLLAEFEQALVPNSYRVRHLAENDSGYSYESSPDVAPAGCYEIELVVEKIRNPTWTLQP
jgi:hypothetical protein